MIWSTRWSDVFPEAVIRKCRNLSLLRPSPGSWRFSVYIHELRLKSCTTCDMVGSQFSHSMYSTTTSSREQATDLFDGARSDSSAGLRRRDAITDAGLLRQLPSQLLSWARTTHQGRPVLLHLRPAAFAGVSGALQGQPRQGTAAHPGGEEVRRFSGVLAGRARPRALAPRLRNRRLPSRHARLHGGKTKDPQSLKACKDEHFYVRRR